MKKTIFIIILLFIISIFIHIPKYLELNELMIINKIEIDCKNKTIKYNEIIPYKSNNSIDYENKEYTYYYNNINDFFNMNNIYYKKAKIELKNCKKK